VGLAEVKRDSYDVAVIGAGIGGLAAGALLARKGLSVAVFEAGRVAGGYCTSFRRKGYTFDSCLDAVSGGAENGWLRRVLRQLGVDSEVELVRLDPLRVDNFAGEMVAVPGDINALLDKLCGIAPSEKDGIRGLFGAMDTVYRIAMVTMPEVLYNEPRLDRRLGALAKFRKLSFKDLLDDYVKDAKVRAVLCDRSAFMGLPPSKVSAVAMITMFMTYAAGGGYRIKDGSEKLAAALVNGLTKAGGELFIKSPVTEILKSGGRASGVVVDGQHVAARAIVSAIDASRTAGLAGIAPGTAGMKPSVSFFMVYLGLDKVLDMPDGMGCYPGYDIEGTFTDIADDIVSPKASMEIVNYSNISPSMAPDGGSTVMLISKAAYHYHSDWKSCKEREMDRLIDFADSTVPGIKGCVSYAEAATPLTLERYTDNCCGAAFGWEQGTANRRTPAVTQLPGLYMAGHWTYPGGGIESVAASGIVAAEKVSAGL